MRGISLKIRKLEAIFNNTFLLLIKSNLIYSTNSGHRPIIEQHIYNLYEYQFNKEGKDNCMRTNGMNGSVSFKIFDMRDDFYFYISFFPFWDSDVPRRI